MGHTRLRPALLCLLLLAAACSSQPAPAPTAVPATPTAVPATPTALPNVSPPPTPAPMPAGPQQAELRPVERVRVYAGSAIRPSECIDLVADMVLHGASTSTPATFIECTPGAADHIRARYTRAADGVLELLQVELFVLLSEDYPRSIQGVPLCRDVVALLHPASRPAEEAGFVAVCNWLPPLRGAASRPVIETWSGVPEGSSQTTFPPDTPCWRLLSYLGGQLEARTVKVPCVIE